MAAARLVGAGTDRRDRRLPVEARDNERVNLLRVGNFRRRFLVVIVEAMTAGAACLSRGGPRAMPVRNEAARRLRPYLKAKCAIAGDQFGAMIAVQVDGGDVAQRLRAADDVRAARRGQPDANDPRLVRVERDAIAAPVGVEVGKQPSTARVRPRREHHETQAKEKQRPDDAESRGHG